MAITVSYELSLDYTIPEELLEKMDELNEDPEPVSLDSDGTLTVELDGEEYKLDANHSLLAEEVDALETVGFSTEAIEEIIWSGDDAIVHFADISYTP